VGLAIVGIGAGLVESGGHSVTLGVQVVLMETSKCLKRRPVNFEIDKNSNKHTEHRTFTTQSSDMIKLPPSCTPKGDKGTKIKIVALDWSGQGGSIGTIRDLILIEHNVVRESGIVDPGDLLTRLDGHTLGNKNKLTTVRTRLH